MPGTSRVPADLLRGPAGAAGRVAASFSPRLSGARGCCASPGRVSLTCASLGRVSLRAVVVERDVAAGGAVFVPVAVESGSEKAFPEDAMGEVTGEVLDACDGACERDFDVGVQSGFQAGFRSGVRLDVCLDVCLDVGLGVRSGVRSGFHVGFQEDFDLDAEPFRGTSASMAA